MRARDELLAGAALARDEDRRGRRRGLADVGHQPSHRLARAHDAADPEPRLELEVLAGEAARVEDAPERVQDVLGGEGLLEEVVGPGAHGLHRRPHVAVPRDHDDRRRDAAAADLRERVEAVLSRHLDVEEDRVVVRRLGDGVDARRDGRDLVPLLGEERPQGLADVDFVVADEDAARHSGRS